MTDFGFTGQRVEAGFGLMDYNARFYSGRLGRFVSADTITPDPNNPQAFNRYTYAHNNPVRYFDKDGHCLPFCIIIPYLQIRNAASPSELSRRPQAIVDMGIPVLSSIAQYEVYAAESAWQAMHGVDAAGNELSQQQRIDHGVGSAIAAVGGAMESLAVAAIAYIGFQQLRELTRYVAQTPERATANRLINEILDDELSEVQMTVKPSYNPNLKSAYGASVQGEFSQIGQPSMQGGRLEVTDTLLHEELHQRLWLRGVPAPHNEDYIRNVTMRFTQMKGLGVAPSHLEELQRNIPK